MIQVNSVWIRIISITIWIAEIVSEIYTSKVTVLIRHKLDDVEDMAVG